MAEQQAALELKRSLLDKISSKTVQVGVIGLGYVGLPLSEVFSRAGLTVTGFDIDQRKVDAIHAGKTYVEDLRDEDVRTQVEAGRLKATTDFAHLREMDAVFICVPTPLRKTLDPDISYIVAAVTQIRENLKPGQLIVLESTTYPGTTDEVIQPMLEESGLKAGENFFLAFSPERVDPSNVKYKTENTPKVVGGTTDHCCEVSEALYKTAIPFVHVVGSARAAEMVKLLENTFRMINIGLVNEFALICEKLELDVWEVIDAAATKPFGFMPFYPGPGLGGHCIPIDPHYLSWKLRGLNYFTRFIDLASEINRAMPAHVVRRLSDILNQQKKPMNGSKLLVVGVAYKENISDIRESPAIDVMMLLAEQGMEMSFFDPHVDQLEIEGKMIPRVALEQSALRSHDAVLILTAHDGVDYDMIVREAPLILDTRNATKGTSEQNEGLHRL